MNMKSLKLMILFCLVASQSFGQTVNYKIIKDQPDDVANYWINFELLQFELAYKNMSGGNFGLGLNSVVNYHNKMGAEFTFRRSYLTLLEGANRTQFEIGAFYNLISRTKTRSQKVVLSSRSYSSGGKTYTETKSIQVPGTVLKSLGLRGGLAYNSIPFEAELEEHEFAGKFKIQTFGLYAGILNTKQMNLKINTDDFGTKGTGFVRRYYLDVLFNPVRSMVELNTDIKNETNKPGVFGFRGGVEFLLPEPRKVHGNSMYTKIEAGMRPYEGVYVMGSFGFSFKRKSAKLGKFEPIREME